MGGTLMTERTTSAWARPAGAGAALAVSLSLSAPAAAQQLTRGPYLQSVTQSSVYVVWEQDAPSRPEVRYGSAAGSLNEAVTAPSTGTRPEVQPTGLAPGHTYHYGVFQDGSKLSADGLTIPTAVTAGTSFRFILYGDTRSDAVAHQQVINAMAAEEGVRLVLHTGDLVSDGEISEQWDELFALEQPLIGSVPMFAVLGNHETNDGWADLYFDSLVLPANAPVPEAFYSFDYGSVHFLALDSHINAYPWYICITDDKIYDLCFTEEQLSWLESDLDAANDSPDIEHIVVVIHAGPYTSMDDRSGNGQIRELLDLFAQKRVSLIVSGHDHYYERGTSSNGIPYIITGGGGAPLYEIGAPNGEPHTVEHNASVHHYVIVDVEGSELKITAMGLDGQPIDTLSLLPPQPPPPPAPVATQSEDSGCCIDHGRSAPAIAGVALGLLLLLGARVRGKRRR